MHQHMEILKKYNLKATPQRLCILKILSNHTHPTIDELLDEIRKEYPSISLATVYKNLNILLDQGFVVEVNSPNNKARFDIYETPHFHSICEKCNHIEDIFYDENFLNKISKDLKDRLSGDIKNLNILITTKSCKNCS